MWVRFDSQNYIKLFNSVYRLKRIEEVRDRELKLKKLIEENKRQCVMSSVCLKLSAKLTKERMRQRGLALRIKIGFPSSPLNLVE